MSFKEVTTSDWVESIKQPGSHVEDHVAQLLTTRNALGLQPHEKPNSASTYLPNLVLASDTDTPGLDGFKKQFAFKAVEIGEDLVVKKITMEEVRAKAVLRVHELETKQKESRLSVEDKQELKNTRGYLEAEKQGKLKDYFRRELRHYELKEHLSEHGGKYAITATVLLGLALAAYEAYQHNAHSHPVITAPPKQ